MLTGPLANVTNTPDLAMDPYLMMGLGILGSASDPRTLGPNLMQGLSAYNQARQAEVQNTLARQQLTQEVGHHHDADHDDHVEQHLLDHGDPA